MPGYPFLKISMEAVKDLPVPVLVNDAEYLDVMDEAVRRIDSAGTGRPYVSGLADVRRIGGRPFPSDVVTFVVSLLILSMPGLRRLASMWALAESRRAGAAMGHDIIRGRMDRIEALVAEVAGTAIHYRNGYGIPVAGYIRASIGISGGSWKLVNQKVHGGMVFLTQRQLVRLLEERTRLYIVRLLGSVTGVPQSQYINDAAGRLAAEYPQAERQAGSAPNPASYPPCITHAVESLERNENLSHAGRFLLGSYMIRIGRDMDGIVPYFAGAPDYDERVTRYQLGQIANRGYMCPSCDKVRSSNLCYEAPECAGVTNPIQFGRKG